MSSDDGKSPGFDRLGRAVSSKPATMRTGIGTARRLGVTVLTAEHAWAAVPGANVRLIRRRTLPFVTEPERPTWHALAACRGVGPVLFFLEACGSYDVVRVYCARCPVSEECAEAGRSEEYGMWGGKSPHERPRRRRPRAA